jgi:hypothetical protein
MSTIWSFGTVQAYSRNRDFIKTQAFPSACATRSDPGRLALRPRANPSQPLLCGSPGLPRTRSRRSHPVYRGMELRAGVLRTRALGPVPPNPRRPRPFEVSSRDLILPFRWRPRPRIDPPTARHQRRTGATDDHRKSKPASHYRNWRGRSHDPRPALTTSETHQLKIAGSSRQRLSNQAKHEHENY